MWSTARSRDSLDGHDREIILELPRPLVGLYPGDEAADHLGERHASQSGEPGPQPATAECLAGLPPGLPFSVQALQFDPLGVPTLSDAVFFTTFLR